MTSLLTKCDASMKSLRASLTMFALVGGAFSLNAWAVLPVGESPTTFTILDGKDQSLKLEQLRGKSVVFFYETRDEAVIERNRALKKRLLAYLSEQSNWASKVAVVPVIDCSGAIGLFKGFWKDQILENSKKENLTIYCDWSGSFGQIFQADPSQSNVIVLDAAGKVVFSQAGLVPADQFPFSRLIK